MRTVTAVAILLLVAGPAFAQDRLISPYRHQAETGLRGLDQREIAELKAGNGMGLARAAELNSYPGPRHVLDAVAAGKLMASAEQIQRVQRVFDEMQNDARRVGAQILEREQQLEMGFQTASITESDLRERVTRIAALQGELRAIHLAAHLATRAILSDSQVARYNELRGYTTGSADRQEHQHKH
ncbi:MAG TPA: hypothetical protein VGT40_17735 [Methylomirabilota bacterium]|jgi:hypothetical protein|nr:hypothetical protein [Methylomirabilota bacterium]